MWGLYVFFLISMFLADYRTSLVSIGYTDPIDSDQDAIVSGRNIYRIHLSQGINVPDFPDRNLQQFLGVPEVYLLFHRLSNSVNTDLMLYVYLGDLC